MATLHFPDANTITNALMANSFLAEPRFKNMGIIQRITALAGEQLANQQVDPIEVGPIVVNIIHSIQNERGESGQGFVWSQLSSIVTEVLEKCAV